MKFVVCVACMAFWVFVRRPINCVDFHPEGDFVVTGSWDASLKIWDVFNKKKIKVCV